MHYLSIIYPNTHYQVMYFNFMKMALYFYIGVWVAKKLTLLEGDNDSPYIDKLLKFLNIWFFASLIGYLLLKWGNV
mgnify:FL=1